MRQLGERLLWIGHAGDLQQVRAILAAGIEAVVELADSEPPATLPRELIRCRYPLSDGGENPAWLLRLAIETVAALIRAKTPTVVCCSAGICRSVAVTAGGLAKAESLPLAEALRIVVATGPADVSPRLSVQIQQVLDG